MSEKKTEMEAKIERIRAALQDRNMRRVAKATGLHHNTLGNIMKGETTPSVRTLDKLLSYLFTA